MAKEINEVYNSLRRKEEILKQMEQRLNQKISEKDNQNHDLSQRVIHLEETLDRKNGEMMEKTSQQQTNMQKELEYTIEEKEIEIARYREQVEGDFYQREQELIEELQQRQENEETISHNLQIMERDLNEHKKSKSILEKVLEERGSLLSSLE